VLRKPFRVAGRERELIVPFCASHADVRVDVDAERTLRHKFLKPLDVRAL
jgi:hypothetical protein